MNAMEINRLLEKYYSGLSSREEELILSEYFQGNDIPEEFSAEKEIFRHYHRSAGLTEPSADLASRIISAIDSSETGAVPLRFPHRRILAFSGVAAVLIIMVVTYFYFNTLKEPKDTYTNPEIAYAETVRILYGVSSQINQATNKLDNMSRMEDAASKSFATLNRSTAIIDKNLRNLDYFDKVFSIVNSPIDYVIKK